MVNVDIYSKIKIGQEYDTEIMRAITRSASDIQTTTKDSSYTIYTEYMYSANRIEFDKELYMNKGFRLYEAPNPYISVGTKLTLMDLTFSDNPRTYYYEVNSGTSFILLTAFIDEKGNHYKERNINLLSELPEYSSFTTMYVNGRTLKKYNRGVEKYLLFVDCRNVSQTGNESQLSPLIMAGVEASFSDTASNIYWNTIKQYDYNNQGKYLDVAIYLKNENGDKVMLPSGTRIKYGDSDVTYETVKNTSSIFYYKDDLSDTSYELMNINNNTTTDIEFSIDFT